jgi:hypothetical protein
METFTVAVEPFDLDVFQYYSNDQPEPNWLVPLSDVEKSRLRLGNQISEFFVDFAKTFGAIDHECTQQENILNMKVVFETEENGRNFVFQFLGFLEEGAKVN